MTAGEVGACTPRGRLQRAREVQVVGAATAHGHAGAGAVHVLVALQRCVVAHQVGAFDDDAGRGVFHAGRAHRVDGREGPIDLRALAASTTLPAELKGTS